MQEEAERALRQDEDLGLGMLKRFSKVRREDYGANSTSTLRSADRP